jgi:7-keto-8-aminopelargonate synthetase-like enzyme
MRLGTELRAAGLVVPHVDSQILPVLIGEAERAVAVGTRLLDEGVYVAAIRPPTVPPGTSRLRVSLMATHTEADIATAARAIISAVKST